MQNAFMTLAMMLVLTGEHKEIRTATYFPEMYKTIYWPKPTKEMLDLVNKNLASDEWPVREDGTAKLKKMGWKAIGAINEGTKSRDLEVKKRCKRLLGSVLGYYVESPSSIFYINDKTEVTIDGNKKITIPMQIREHFYRQVWKENAKANDWDESNYSMYNSEIGIEATRRLIMTLRMMGVDDNEMAKFLRSIEDNSLEFPDGMYFGHG